MCVYIYTYVYLFWLCQFLVSALEIFNLCCGIRDFFFFLVASCELLVVACGIYFPNQRLNPGPLHWEQRVLATGPPTQPLYPLFKNLFNFIEG